MFCGRCGKRVLDDMLFCPFCGTAIVIPDQEPSAEAEEPVAAPKAAGSLFTEEEIRAREAALEEKKAAEEFVPLTFDFDAPEDAPEDVPEPQAVEVPAENPAPAAKSSPAENPAPAEKVPAEKQEGFGVRPQNPFARSANTYVPVRDVDPNNLFMDDEEEDEYDADEFDSDVDDDPFDFEDKETGGFFHRHVRGMVALILFAVVLLVCVIWGFSANGQLTLAKLNVAWTAEPYAKLGYDAYGAEDYTLSAKYYSRAIALEQDNYEYAHSAMVAEYMADNIDAATVMAKKCIELSPDSAEPYTELQKIYTGKELPWDVKELLRQGYARTGDESLKIGE